MIGSFHKSYLERGQTRVSLMLYLVKSQQPLILGRTAWSYMLLWFGQCSWFWECSDMIMEWSGCLLTLCLPLLLLLSINEMVGNGSINEMVTDSRHTNLSKLRERVRGREAGCAAVHGVAKSQARLSNWKTTGRLGPSHHRVTLSDAGVLWNYPAGEHQSLVVSSRPFLDTGAVFLFSHSEEASW